MSEIIKERINNSGKSFFANDNIADFIQEGELELLQKEVAAKFEAVLQSLVIDTQADHNTQDTAKRVAKMYIKEVFAGRYQSMPEVTEFPNVKALNELSIVGPIQIRSACSHHFCPIIGKVWVGVMHSAHSNLIGLSKYVRLAAWILERPQIQEEAIVQFADLLWDKLKPQGLAVVMKADHLCMQWRGVKDENSKMLSSVMRGSFLKDSDLRKEFLNLLPNYDDK
ncbi:GTP cyclohydrolase I [Brackiella oedipodis]|uniref:GTP cyclohydrolase I n=1 Tax=Brackiella oedipodis TaxID=124225 RepID=UPI0004903839